MKKNIILLATCLLMGSSSLASGPANVAFKVTNGEIQYYAVSEDGTEQPLDQLQMAGILEGLLNKAKNLACGLELKPTEISVSAGVISGVWKTDKLCGK